MGSIAYAYVENGTNHSDAVDIESSASADPDMVLLQEENAASLGVFHKVLDTISPSKQFPTLVQIFLVGILLQVLQWITIPLLPMGLLGLPTVPMGGLVFDIYFFFWGVEAGKASWFSGEIDGYVHSPCSHHIVTVILVIIFFVVGVLKDVYE